MVKTSEITATQKSPVFWLRSSLEAISEGIQQIPMNHTWIKRTPEHVRLKARIFEVPPIRSHMLSVNSIGDEWISVEHWWNGNGWGKLKYWEINLSQRRVMYRNSPMNWPGIEPGPTWWRPTTSRLSHAWSAWNRTTEICNQQQCAESKVKTRWIKQRRAKTEVFNLLGGNLELAFLPSRTTWYALSISLQTRTPSQPGVYFSEHSTSRTEQPVRAADVSTATRTKVWRTSLSAAVLHNVQLKLVGIKDYIPGGSSGGAWSRSFTST